MIEDGKNETSVRIISGSQVPEPDRTTDQKKKTEPEPRQTEQAVPSYARPAPGAEPYTQPTPQQTAASSSAYAPPGQTPVQQAQPAQQTYAGQSAQPYAQAPQQAAPVYGQQASQYGYTAQAGPQNGQTYGQSTGQQPYVQSPYSQFAQAQYGQPNEPPRQKKEKKPREKGKGGLGIGRMNTAILVIIVVVACVASGIGGGYIGAGMNNTVSVTESDGNATITINPSNDITTTEAVAKKVLSSVVGITSTGSVVSSDFFFGPSEQEVSGVGTGMIIDEKGYILTNSHVVMDGAVTSITVLLSSGEEVEGTVIWSDSSLDLAIVKVEVEGLQAVELGDSDEVTIGSYVAAIGNPLGLEFSGSITQGVVSGLDRTITVIDETTGVTSTMEGLIQVDAAINSGNSGGPLLDSQGRVIGINTAKATAEGMGFAIPINTAIPIVEKVIQDGSFERVYLGVSAADVDVIKENYPNVEILADYGACITEVNAGSPAEKAGLKVKDVIIAVDGEEVSGSTALIKLLLGYSSGDTATITYIRDGQEQETTVTLVSQDELTQAIEQENPFREPSQGNAGR